MNAPSPLPRLHLLRHGETDWARLGRHTGRTDVSLTARGEAQARQLGERLQGRTFAHVFTSPRERARHTCELAGLGPQATVADDLREWDYGDYEGRTTAEIHADRPAWNLFTDGAPGGENPAAVYARALELVRRVQSLDGEIAIFSHGHFLRVLAAAWVGFPVTLAAGLELGTASHSILGHEHNLRERPCLSLWNATGPAVP